LKAGTKKSTEASNPSKDQAALEQKKEKKRKRPAKASMVNKLVTFAPEANITFGDDIPDDGKRLLMIVRGGVSMPCGRHVAASLNGPHTLRGLFTT